MRNLVHRPSPATVIACIALLLAMGGTGFAAATAALAPNSVGTVQLRNNAVTNAKLRRNAVTSDKVANRSLTRIDFAPGQIPSGPAGAVGPAGPAGPQGAQGPQGPAGAVGTVTVRQASVVVPGAGADNPTPNTLWSSRTIDVTCNSNERAMSAGTGWSADANDLELATVYMKPVFSGTGPVTGFTAKGANNARDGQDHTFTLYVLCYPA